MLESVETILSEYSKDNPDFQEIEKSVERILNDDQQDDKSILDKGLLNSKFDHVYGYNLIHFVIMHGQLDLLKKLLNDESSSKFLHQKTKVSNQFPIDIAIEYQQIACLKLLLKHYSSEHKQEPEVINLVKKAIENKNVELLEALLSGGVFIEQNLSSEDEKINNLLKQRYQGIEKFLTAAKSDNSEAIDEYIKKGINLTPEYFSVQGDSNQELEAELSFQQAIVYQKLALNEKAVQNLMRIEKLAVSDEIKVKAKKMVIQVIESHFHGSQARLAEHSPFAMNRFTLFSNVNIQTDEIITNSLSAENESVVLNKSKTTYNE